MIVPTEDSTALMTPRDKSQTSLSNMISPDSGASSGERAPRKPPSGKKRPANVIKKSLDFEENAVRAVPTKGNGRGGDRRAASGTMGRGSDLAAPRRPSISSKRASPRRSDYSTGGLNVISPESTDGSELDSQPFHNSPDPTSKFHTTRGQKFWDEESKEPTTNSTPLTSNKGHELSCISPMPSTPTEQQLIIDLEKKMADAMEAPFVYDAHVAPGPNEGGLESPDVLSRFNKTAALRGALQAQVSASPALVSDDSGHDFSPMPSTPLEDAQLHGDVAKSSYSHAPIIYGNGVVVDSPDVLSKFNASGRRPLEMRPSTPTAPAAEREHDFSPTPGTPASPGPALLKKSPGARGMPLIIGQGVSIESPDVLSKFSASGRPMMVSVVTPKEMQPPGAREHDFSPMPTTPVTPGADQQERLLGIAPPRFNAMPTIYGQGVTVESPDLLSKFNAQQRAITFMSPVEEGPSEHDFSPMPATPTEYLPQQAKPVLEQAPIIYGNGVEVDSPDVLSKFNRTEPIQPESRQNIVIEAAKVEVARSTVPVVHRKRFLRNQSYVTSSDEGGFASSARPPDSMRPSKQSNAAPPLQQKQQPQGEVLDLFSETLSPLKENYGNLLQSIQGEIRRTHKQSSKGSFESPKKSIGTPRQNTSPLVQITASPAPVSTFAAMVHTMKTPKSRTPPRRNQKLDQFINTLSPYKDNYAEIREKINEAATTPVRPKEVDIFADTLSPFMDDYAEVRERVNEMVMQEELEKVSSVQVSSHVGVEVKKPAPPPPRRKQAFPINVTSPAKPLRSKDSGAGSSVPRGGRSSSPMNSLIAADGGANVQILNFETTSRTCDAKTPPRELEHGSFQFRRRGRILRESASEPIIQTAPMLAESPSIEPSQDHTQPSRDGNEENEIFSAIERFEHSYEDDSELRPMTLLNESDQADRFGSDKALEEVIDEDLSTRVKVTFVGSNLALGETLKKEKKRRRSLFGPFQPNLEQLTEDAEVVLCFPSWIMPVPRFMKKVFPMQSVQVKVSSDDNDIGQSGEVESTLGSQELKLVGRIRRRNRGDSGRPEASESPENVVGDSPKEEETPLHRDDTYGNWVRAQETAFVRMNDEGERLKMFDDIFVAIETRNNGLLKELTREGLSMVDPECRDSIGNTPLIAAVIVNNKKIVKLLLKHGVDFDAYNKHGNTALHFAAEYQLASTTKYLLKKGASRTIRNSIGMLPGERVKSDVHSHRAD